MRQRISPDAAVLDAAHKIHPWVPSAAHVRPLATVLHLKQTAYDEQPHTTEWIWHEVFMSVSEPERPCAKLHRQPFPYQVPAGTVHMVCWFAGCPREDWSEHAIFDAISTHIDDLGGGEFVYYENPKKSITHPRLHHEHVYWRQAL